MRIKANEWEALRVTDVLLDGHLVQNVTEVDNVIGYVDAIRPGNAVRPDGEGPIIDRLYGHVTIIYPHASGREENRSGWSRRKRRREFRRSQRRTHA